jgi:deoxycytidylate deaminase
MPLSLYSSLVSPLVQYSIASVHNGFTQLISKATVYVTKHPCQNRAYLLIILAVPMIICVHLNLPE